MILKGFRLVFVLTSLILVLHGGCVYGVINSTDLNAWNFFRQALQPNNNAWYFLNCKCNGPNVDQCNVDGDGSPCGCINGIHQVVCEEVNGEDRIVEIILPSNRLFGNFPRNAVLQMERLRRIDVSSSPQVQRDSNRLQDQSSEGCYRFDRCYQGLQCNFANAFESGIDLCPSPAPTVSPSPDPTIPPTPEPTLATEAPSSSSPTTGPPTLVPTTSAPSTPPTIPPTTAAPTAPTVAPTIPTNAPSPDPTVPPTPIPTSSGSLVASEQRAWERVYDSLNGQNWEPCPITRESPCSSGCSASQLVRCATLEGRRVLQEADEPQLTVLEISLPQNSVQGELDDGAFDDFPSLHTINFHSNSMEMYRNEISGNGPDSCIVLPACFEAEFRCDFVGTGPGACSTAGVEEPIDSLMIAGLVLLGLLVFFFLIFCILFLIWNWYPEYVPDPVDKRFESWTGRSREVLVSSDIQPEPEDIQIRLDNSLDSDIAKQKDLIAKNPDLQRAKQEALDVERVVSKDIESIDDLLRQAKMPQHTEKFHNEGMDLQAVLLANNKQLKTLGLPLGDRVKLLRVTKLIREMQ